MRNFLSSKITQIPPSGIRKFFDIVTEMKDAVSLGVGEPDFDTPWRVRDEAITTLEQGKTFYTSNSGLMELRESISAYNQRKYNISYDPKSEIIITVGGSEAIDIGLRAVLEPGDEVLIPQPSYVSYEPCAIMAGGVPVIIPLSSENDFRLTPEDLKKYITDRTKVLILPFPNNPTGAIMEASDLEKIHGIILEHDLLVMTDEIYSELTYGRRHVSIASLPGMKERTIYINGFSKAFAMTGWRLGYACGPSDIIQQMTKIHQFAIMCAPTNSQYAAVTALNDCDEDVEAMRDEYDLRRHYLMERFSEMGIPCFEPYGAFYMFPDIRKFGMSSDEFATALLKEQKLATVPGTAFGAGGEGFLRISYAYSMEMLKEGMDRLERFVNGLS